MIVYPKISIVTPSFNQGRFIEKTILSVIEQDYPNIEYIIIDGGSTDESVEIIKKYEKHLAYWVSEPDRGQSHAINKGFERATGDIFGWLNSDDWYHPGVFNAVAEAFTANPDAGAVVGAGEMYYQQTGEMVLVEAFSVTTEMLYGAVDKYFMQPSCFFTAKAWTAVGGLDETLHLAMDLDLWLKIAKTYKFVSIDNSLSVSTVHENAKTTEYASQSLVDACLVIIKHGGYNEGRNRLVEFLEELRYYRENYNKTKSDIERLKIDYAETINVLKGIESSLSWKLTSPIRSLLDMFFKRGSHDRE